MSEDESNGLSIQELLNQEYNLKKRLREPNDGIVSIGSGEFRIAKSSEIPGKEFPLSKFLSEKGFNIVVNEKDKHPIDRVFIRTETGNIYGFRHSDKGAEIINAGNGDIVPIIMTNSPLTIRVGEEFRYLNELNSFPLHTSKVVEIVAVTKKIQGKTDTEIYNMGEGRETTILKDFRQLLKVAVKK